MAKMVSRFSKTMFLMAWPLEFGKLQQSCARPIAPLLGAAFNLILIPLLVWPLAALAGTELGPGIIITAATPSTLASAACSHPLCRRRRQRGSDGDHFDQCHLFFCNAILDLSANWRPN